VTSVINYDCPFNTTDYLHRTGRTGRATELFSGEGEALTYVTQNKQVIFAKKIQVYLCVVLILKNTSFRVWILIVSTENKY